MSRAGGISKACRTMVVLTVLCLPMFSGCSAQAVKPVMPPTPALEPREMPRFQGKTYRDLVDHILRLEEWGGACEADKSATRAVIGESTK